MKHQITTFRAKALTAMFAFCLGAPSLTLAAETQTNPSPNPPLGAMTAEHIEELNRYAEQALKGRIQETTNRDFKKLGFEIEGIDSLDSLYSISVISGKECFYESGQIGGKYFDPHLVSEKNVAAVREQIDSAAEFIRQIHLSTRGKRLGPFNVTRIDICSAKKLGGSLMRIEPSRMVIGMPILVVTNSGLKSHTSMELMDLWNSGAGLKDATLKKLWIALNPVGPVRTSLRSLIDRVAKLKAKELEQTANKSNIVPAMAGLIKASVNQEALKGSLCIEPATWASTLNESDSRRLLEAWHKRLLDSTLQESLLDDASALALEQTEVSEDLQLDVKMNGMVNIGNYHRIDVSAPLSVGRYQRYIKTLQRKTKIDVKTNGLVNVYTIDDIRVASGIQISLDKALESASFEEAYKDLAPQTNCGL